MYKNIAVGGKSVPPVPQERPVHDGYEASCAVGCGGESPGDVDKIGGQLFIRGHVGPQHQHHVHKQGDAEHHNTPVSQVDHILPPVWAIAMPNILEQLQM